MVGWVPSANLPGSRTVEPLTHVPVSLKLRAGAILGLGFPFSFANQKRARVLLLTHWDESGRGILHFQSLKRNTCFQGDV